MEALAENKPHISELRLHTITQEMGLPGLLERYNYDIQVLPKETQEQLNKALALALVLHAEDTYKGFPYATHLVRVMLRLMRDYNTTDPDLLVAALLHDSVEDHPTELIHMISRGEYSDNLDAKTALGLEFGNRAANLVDSVTNKELPPDTDKKDKNFIYAKNLETKIASSFEVFILKLSDFTDNGVGLHWGEDAEKTTAVAIKYMPIFDIFLKFVNVYEQSGHLTFEQAKLARSQLIKGKNTAFEVTNN
jgi:(p)ppGpp synthase/HD superfamily hydrolase